jgi:hypothetical protein
MAAACLLLVALGLLTALAMRPFTAGDENAHTSYALQVASGSLPTMRSLTVPEIPGMGRQNTYVANHPPLYYGVAGLPMRLGVGAGQPRTGFLVGRLVTLAFMALSVLGVGWLAYLVLPARPSVGVAAAAVMAATPFFPSTGAQIANDAAALATTVAVLVLAVVLLRAPSWRRVWVLGVVCALAALTRSTGVTVGVLAAGAAAVAMSRVDRSRVQRLARAGLAALAIVVPVALASGWFYLRNRQLYGDPLGVRYALELFPGGAHLGLDQTLLSWHFWLGQSRQLLTRGQYVTGVVSLLGKVVLVLVVAGVAALAVRGVLGARSRSLSFPARDRLVIGLLGVHVVIAFAAQLQYLSQGGYAYIRYALPAFPVLALIVGAALLALPCGRRGVFVVAAVTMLSTISIIVLSKGIAFRPRGWEGYGILERYRVGMAANGIPAPAVVVGLLLGLVVLAVALLAWSLARAHRPAASS